MVETKKTNLTDKAVLLVLKLGKFGNSKRVKDAGAIEVRPTSEGQQADKDLIRVTKQLLDAPEIDAIGKFDAEIRGYVYGVSMPCDELPGFSFVANEMIEQVDAELTDMKAKRAVLVALAKDAYPKRVEETQARLGIVADATDYPGAEEFAEDYTMSYRFVSLAVPDALKGDLRDREAMKAADAVVSAEDAMRERMRSNFYDIVSHMEDRLNGTRENGKIKIFRDSMLENAVQFMQGFAFRNLANDDELAALVAEAQDILDGLTAEDLRTVEEVRANVLAGFQQIKAQLEEMGAKA